MVADHDTAGMCVPPQSRGAQSVGLCERESVKRKGKRHTHEINFVIWTNDFMLLLLLFNTTRARMLSGPRVTRVSNYLYN